MVNLIMILLFLYDSDPNSHANISKTKSCLHTVRADNIYMWQTAEVFAGYVLDAFIFSKDSVL